MIPGFGQCGCENPRFHQRGCLWNLDRRGRKRDTVGGLAARVQHLEQQLAAVIAVTAPRPGHCVLCWAPLDREAIDARDMRCSRCYRAIISRRGGAA